MATEDARYRQSTQFRFWTFSQPQLRSMREKTNNLARAAITARLNSTSASDGKAAELPKFLTPAEEARLLTFYTVELLRAASFVELPTDIRATAAIFLRRFYVTNSIMTYPPTELLKTCLFFGAKADGYYMRLSKFAEKFPRTTQEEVLAAEYILCQGIRFAFDVRHPYRGLEGAVMELRRLGGFDDNRIGKAHARARDILKFSPLVTDAYFHFTPSQIMLASLAMADSGMVERFLRDALAGASETAHDKVWSVVEQCREVLEEEPPERLTDYWGTVSKNFPTAQHTLWIVTCRTQPESNATIKPLIKKLKKCRDPDRVDLVALQKARREQALHKGSNGKPSAKDDSNVFSDAMDDGRESKRRKVADDPFGPAL